MVKQIGIDLGTANVLVYMRGRGIVINEPSVVAISAKDGKVKAVGLEARNMLGREPRETIEVVRPMRDGVIADYVVTQEMLKYFISKAAGRFSLVRPEVMICVPAGVTGVERRAVRDAALADMTARSARLVLLPLAARLTPSRGQDDGDRAARHPRHWQVHAGGRAWPATCRAPGTTRTPRS